MQTKLPESFTPQFLKKLELQRIQAQRSFLGSRQGGHFSLKRGHGIEFSDYRKYEPGDDPRHIDHKLMARSERVYIKRFREEQDLLVHIFLDTSKSMFVPEMSKWQRAKELALAIGYIASMQQDRVQLSVPGHFVYKRYAGKSIIYKMARDLEQLGDKAVDDFEDHLKTAVAAANFPGVAFVISDFLNDLNQTKSLFTDLLGKNLDLNAVQVLSPNEIEPDLENALLAIDCENQEKVELKLDSNSVQEYKSLLQSHNQELKSFLLARKISWTSCASEDVLDDIVLNVFKAY